MQVGTVYSSVAGIFFSNLKSSLILDFFFCVLVVDSILRGVEVGIGPRRTRQTNKEQQAITVSLYLSIEKTVLW